MSETKIAGSPLGRELLEEGDMQAAGKGDGDMGYMKMVFVQPAGSRDAQLLDEVFDGFVQTNIFQGRHYSMSMLFNIHEKLHFRFQHSEVPYLATAHRHRGPDGDSIVLKLPNNGFSYLEKVRGEEFFWHKQPGWVTLPAREAMAQFPKLQQAVRSRFSQVVIFYNFEKHRIDLEFEPKVPSDPALLVNFEPGSPFLDTKPLRRPF